MRHTTCRNCLSFTSHRPEVKVLFCFHCGKKLPTIPDDAHKDFTNEPVEKDDLFLTNLSRKKAQKMMNKQISEVAKAIKTITRHDKELMPDWEEKDWYERIKKL